MKTYAFDIECYKDYFLALFIDIRTNTEHRYEMYEGKPFPEDEVRALITNNRIISFNGTCYDVPILSYALFGATNKELKEASDKIIVDRAMWWDLERDLGFPILKIEHIDLMNVAPGKASLKIYGARLNSKKLQDLPIEPDASISPQDREDLAQYCVNDVQTTIDLYRALLPQLKLRSQMSNEYGIDLRSKSDAQIAEAVLTSEIKKLTGRYVKKTEIRGCPQFKYDVPDYIAFQQPATIELLEDIRSAFFGVTRDGKIVMPGVLDNRSITLCGKKYKLGIGGLHSQESATAYDTRKDGSYKIYDRDVASYYPAIILGQKLAPPHIGESFLTCYKSIVDRRLAAKRSGDKVTAESLKITINGSFGKFGSKYSRLFAPKLLIQTTVTGQLSLLMLIEMMEATPNEVVSANTDGIVILCRDESSYMDVISTWELMTGFVTEETEYAAIYSRDVNNYIAIKTDGSAKKKGVFAYGGLMKNPCNIACIEAVEQKLVNGTPVEETIRSCRDVEHFLTCRSVTGGAVYNGEFLGKAVRWYYSSAKGPEDCITYKDNGNKVARSEGCCPMMELQDEVPADLDYAWYVKEANSMLGDVGFDT